MIYTSHIISDLKKFIPEDKKVFVIMDTNLLPYIDIFKEYEVIELKTSEKNKSMQTVEHLAELLIERGADRDSFILGAGGGITTDLTGFLASIYKRGVGFAFVPTTLLAQVDASIGGKNGVNVDSFKNMLGVIRQPQWIFSCVGFLKTLDAREFTAGVSEVLKTFILFDRKYYQKSVDLFSFDRETILNDRIEELSDIIKKCSDYKLKVVEIDEFEKGERRLLNLGHTFGHAIEKYSKDGIMHGEAVAIGMVIAAKIAAMIGGSSDEIEFVNRLSSDLNSVGLPSEFPTDINTLLNAVANDKKASGESIHFILPHNIEMVEDRLISFEQLRRYANDLQ